MLEGMPTRHKLSRSAPVERARVGQLVVVRRPYILH
jgi:hypothetical protein